MIRWPWSDRGQSMFPLTGNLCINVLCLPVNFALSKGLSSVSWGLETFRYCPEYSWVLRTHERSWESLATVLRQSWESLCPIRNVLSLSWAVLAYLCLSWSPCHLLPILLLFYFFSLSPFACLWLDSIWLAPRASGADTCNGSGADRSINLG